MNAERLFNEFASAADTTSELSRRLTGLLLGTAVGDALGLPAEGLSRSRIERRWHGVWRHRFLFGRGMCSDDTEHTVLVAQALLAHPEDPAAFQRCLGWKLRLWLLGLPAGIGLATLRSILKLWVGFPPHRSGVFSAGNGPAMRSAILGACFATEPAKRRAFVSAATRITHTDPKAETAAMAVAEAAAWAVCPNEPIEKFLERLPSLGQDNEWPTLCRKLSDALARGASVLSFAEELGLGRGVSGYAYHSVPVALYAWLRHPNDFPAALQAAFNCGGDTDTVGAIVGALAGASCGEPGIPAAWLQGIWEWPRSTTFLKKVARRLAQQKAANHPLDPVRYCWPGLLPRNLLFMNVVLAHGFRRLVPL
jgi:ADP-ribosyl-[dinitrogen reductase] hydrolase